MNPSPHPDPTPSSAGANGQWRDTGPARLKTLDDAFLDAVASEDAGLRSRLESARRNPDALGGLQEAELLIALSPFLEAFLARHFDITAELEALKQRADSLERLRWCKWKFVKRQATLGDEAATADQVDPAIEATTLGEEFGFGSAGAATLDELRFAQACHHYQRGDGRRAEHAAERLGAARRYAAWAALTEAGLRAHPDSMLFRLPQAIDPRHRIHGVRLDDLRMDGLRIDGLDSGAARAVIPIHRIDRPLHPRRVDAMPDPFLLTDARPSLEKALDEIHYCLLCHRQGKDSCSRGLPARTGDAGDAPQMPFAQMPFAQTPFARSPAGELLHGCPLGERISEFHTLKGNGLAIAALAMIVIDNPMVAGTGHRICNDCMKSCIYQQQDPVDIPQVETRVLRDVLELPWGFEILSLLTQWNPLNLRHPMTRASSGRTVLVAGQGPAGFTLAHHLLQQGHRVLAIDALPIAALPRAWLDAPIRDIRCFDEDGPHVPQGFGGVAEYGITARWDKRFLRILRLLLERRANYRIAGGIRFGGALDVPTAFAMGIDHIALCLGAGRPQVPSIPDALAPGVRTASDFLMALQSGGAARTDSWMNVQIELPVVVIGGGLTAVDAATECLAWYPIQVERMLVAHEMQTVDEEADGEADKKADKIANEKADDRARRMLDHARALRAEREAARRENRAPAIVALLQQWGGVTIAYRGRFEAASAYRVNPEELQHALDEGITMASGLHPESMQRDAQGHVRAVRFTADDAPRSVELPARTVLLAIGTKPNTVLADEDPERFERDRQDFRSLGLDRPVEPEATIDTSLIRGNPKAPRVPWVVYRNPDGRSVTQFGDLHPAFSGNVVKAMASARRGAQYIDAILPAMTAMTETAMATVAAKRPDPLDALLEACTARLESVRTLAPGIVELVVHAPLAAARFEPGLFYRFQADTPLGRTEPLALTGALVDAVEGRVHLVALELGASSRLVSLLQAGTPVTLMGPVGTPTELPSNQTVLLVGGGLGNAVLLAIGRALRAAGSRVRWYAGYRDRDRVFRRADVQAAADEVVWCCEHLPLIDAQRSCDRSIHGTVVDAMAADAAQRNVPGGPADRIIAIGPEAMMAAVQSHRHSSFAPLLQPDHVAIGSINAPMQCMMKGVCGQCLLSLKDPRTGETKNIFCCAEQDQPLESVDFGQLRGRLGQNGLLESIADRRLDALKGGPA